MKPKKGSVALREELKGKIGKASGTSAKQTTSTETTTAKVLPSVVLKLRVNFESPENVTHCLRNFAATQQKRHSIMLECQGTHLVVVSIEATWT